MSNFYTTPRNKLKIRCFKEPTMDYLCLVDCLYEQVDETAKGNGQKYSKVYPKIVSDLFPSNQRTSHLRQVVFERLSLMDKYDKLSLAIKQMVLSYHHIQVRYHLDVIQDTETTQCLLENLDKLAELVKIEYRLVVGFEWLPLPSHKIGKAETQELYQKLSRSGFDLHWVGVFSGSNQDNPYIETWHSDLDKLISFRKTLIKELEIVSQVRAIQEQLNEQ